MTNKKARTRRAGWLIIPLRYNLAVYKSLYARLCELIPCISELTQRF